MMKKNLLFTAYFLPAMFSLSFETAMAQISLNNSYFPLAGNSYARLVCSKGNVGSPGPAQQYNFENSQVWSNDSLKYQTPASTGYSAYHPGSTVAFVLWGTVSVFWYYTADANAVWTSGGTIKGNFGQGTTSVHANHPAQYVDTLLSNEYTYGHTETEISAIRFQNVSPGIDYQFISGKYIAVDGWGSLITPLDTFNNVLRVKYIEFKYDTVFSYDTASAGYVPVDATLDTLYYYKYFAEGKRHPVVIAHTNELDSIEWTEILTFPDVVLGCTDSAAENFNPLANTNDGTCIYCNLVNYSISPDTSICQGESITLTASGATNYVWSTGETMPTITVAPDSATTYSVYLSNLSYCWDIASVKIAVSEEVQAGFWADFSNFSDSILFVNTSMNATDYFWDFDNSAISTDKDPRHIFTSAGNKTVTLVASNDCSTDTFLLTFYISGTEDLESHANPVQITPNPSSGKFSIQTAGESQPDFNILIYNILGEAVYQSGIKTRPSAIDLSDQPKGIYFVQIQSEEKNYYKQIIIQ